MEPEPRDGNPEPEEVEETGFDFVIGLDDFYDLLMEQQEQM